MAQFANVFSETEIREQLVPLIPWGTMIEIMKKSNTHEEMLWYINQTYQNGWSRSMILNQFKLKAYQRSLIEPTIGLLLCKEADNFVAQTTLKNTYNKVGISKYKWVEDLPIYLENKLKQIK